MTPPAWMRALTLTQPWAGLVASGIKLIENRPRPMIKREDFGAPFALHASREIDPDVYDRIVEIAPELWGERNPIGDWYRLTRITSAVIAVATVDSVLDPLAHGILPDHPDAVAPLRPDQRRWFFGPIGYMLRDVRALATPVPCRGWQGFWYLTPKDERERGELSAVERAVLEQLT